MHVKQNFKFIVGRIENNVEKVRNVGSNIYAFSHNIF